jgi:hypothetical protein
LSHSVNPKCLFLESFGSLNVHVPYPEFNHVPKILVNKTVSVLNTYRLFSYYSLDSKIWQVFT